MRGRTLRVLMWKHLMVRMKRFVQTPVELFSPLACFLILYLCKNIILSNSYHRSMDSLIRTPEIKPLSTIPPPKRIFYYPDTNQTGTLIDEVGKRINWKRFNGQPDHTGRYYSAVNNLDDFTSYMTNFTTDEVLVIFKELDVWPNKLSYTIRMNLPFQVHTITSSMDASLVPHAQFGVMYEEFVYLQWLIDTSYITMISGNNVMQEPYMQEFPYYGNDQALKALLVFSLCNVCSVLAFFLYFVFHMSRILEERVSGVQELTKMIGVSTTTLNLSHFLNVLPVGVLYAIAVPCILMSTDKPLVQYSNGFLMSVMLLFQFFSVTTMAYACSYFTDTTQYSVSISVFTYVIILIPSFTINNLNLPNFAITLSGILPGVPAMWYWDELKSLEQYEYGLSFSEVWQSHSSKTGPYMLSLLYLLIQTVLFYGLGLYLGCVKPGKYGQVMPWNFLFQKQYWSKIEPDWIEEEEPIVQEKKFFEKSPKDNEIGIKIVGVSKVFPNQKALTDVNLDVYKGEITILLGHNGAGKTTLMSIITGMISPTKGKVFVNGLDIARHRNDVRKTMGLCPQHNLFFSDLNVLEHIIFFTMLKNGTYSEAKRCAMDLLKQLGIEDKASQMSSALSGGMKRRLQLACALAGGAELLVLDEPTSGLDVQTRRDLWDLLLSLRAGRTVVLSTHFMEEAEALGDRVAALHHGRLRCHATTLYLKRAVGTGYRLSITTNGPPREESISPVVTSQVREAALSHRSLNSLTYALPGACSAQFPELFSTLEDRKVELGIENIGVGISTLEEVFLKLCSDSDHTMTEDEIDGSATEICSNKVSNCRLFQRQFFALLNRQIKFVLSKKGYFALMQIIIPIVLITSFTDITGKMKALEAKEKQVSLDWYSKLNDRMVMYNINTAGVDIGAVAKKYPNVKFVKTDNVADAILETGKRNILDYNKYLLGIELNDTAAKVLYTTIYRHTAPTAMNLLTNILASEYLSFADGQTIKTYNYPVQKSRVPDSFNDYVTPKSQIMCVVWASLMVFILATCLIGLSSLPSKERLSGTRHIHIMAGCPTILHFGTTLIFHMVLTCFTIILAIIISCKYIEVDHTLDQTDFILYLTFILFMSSLSFLAFVYLIAFWFGERGTGIILFVVLTVFGMLTPVLQIGLKAENSNNAFAIFCDTFLSWTMPPHTIMLAVAKCVNVARLNAVCLLNRNKCPALFIFEAGFDIGKCCDGFNPRCYMCWDEYSPMRLTVFLMLQFVVFMSLVILSSRGVFGRWYETVLNRAYNPAPPPHTDEVVRAEKVFVEKEIGLDPKLIQDANLALLVNDVHKNYRGFRKSCNAVQGISFSVKKGECFGLLGVNGAGKTTTFKMLTAEEYPTRGHIFGNGYHMNNETGKYLRSLGYCPQFFGLDEFLTGIENIRLMLTLRGLDAEDVDREAKTWIQLVGLEKYGSLAVSGYSGGMKRRLGAACALCCGAAVALLDEPTAGVDVAVRRRLWAALRTSLARGRTVLISSHSMDEMEALCHRVAIMAAGVVRALGSTRELRRRHAAGHALLLKLRHAATPAPSAGDDTDAAVNHNVNSLKNTLQSKFDCTLKDEHKTTLHYHINVSMRNSDLFKTLEALKSSFSDLIEDYSISETTLEEVFLSFAKEQTQEEPDRATNHIV